MNIDQRDLGTIDGFHIVAVLVEDNDTSPEDDDCYSREDLTAYRNGDWGYVGTIITASRAGIELGSSSLWGSAYGSLPEVEEFVNPLNGDVKDFVNGYGPQIISEAIAEARTKLAELSQEDN